MENEDVSFVEYAATFARAERRARRLTVALTVTVATLGLSNLAWLVAALIH